MISNGIKAAQYALWTLIAVLVVGLSAPLRGKGVPEVQFVPLEPIRRAQTAFSRYAVIGSRNLFRVPEGAVPATPIEEVIEESQLKLKVLGTVAGPAEVASAIVEDSTGRVDVISVSQTLQGGVQVERIEKGRIVVLNQGKREAINMAEPETPASLAMLQRGKRSSATVEVIPPPPPAFVAVASPQLAVRIAALTAPPPPPAAPRQAPPPSIAERELPSENSPFARKLGLRTSASTPRFSATAVQVALDEAPFQAVAGQPVLEALLQKVALREGEEILAVNDIPVTASERLPDLLRSLLQSAPARVRIAVDSKSQREIEVVLR